MNEMWGVGEREQSGMTLSGWLSDLVIGRRLREKQNLGEIQICRILTSRIRI